MSVVQSAKRRRKDAFDPTAVAATISLGSDIIPDYLHSVGAWISHYKMSDWSVNQLVVITSTLSASVATGGATSNADQDQRATMIWDADTAAWDEYTAAVFLAHQTCGLLPTGEITPATSWPSVTILAPTLARLAMRPCFQNAALSLEQKWIRAMQGIKATADSIVGLSFTPPASGSHSVWTNLRPDCTDHGIALPEFGPSITTPLASVDYIIGHRGIPPLPIHTPEPEFTANEPHPRISKPRGLAAE
ncbi:unnamed protein product, partial [Amoebophrya sp. A25]|eukprot:GSA25T00015972001.1